MASRPIRSHPLARSPRVDRINRWVAIGFRRGLLFKPDLSPQAIWRAGAKGFDARDEFGPATGGRSEADAADFRLRLDRLCDALREEADLNPLGRIFAWGQLTRIVRQRHRLGRYWRKHPAVLDTELAAPIIVVGQMRAGTTRIHRLLAADPAHAATRFCDSWNPTPRTPDWRPLKSAWALALAHWLNPWLDTIHPFGASRADEELGWLAAALDHCALEAQWQVPSFVAFSETRDPAPVYREFARILQTDAAHHGNAMRPRVMKTPQFAEDLATLLATFPNARIVVAQRDSAEVLDSAVSLVANQTAMQTDKADHDVLQREWQRKIALREARTTAALTDFTGPLARVDFAALGADWRGEIARVYDSLGLSLSPEAMAAMEREMVRSANGAHHLHREHMQEFTTESRAQA